MMSTASNGNASILVVGAGPVGLTISCLLSKMGINCRVIDKRSSLCPYTRAINISGNTLEIFQKIASTKVLEDKIEYLDETNVFWGHRRISKCKVNPLTMNNQKILHISQTEVEKYLLANLKENNINLNHQTELIDFAINSDKCLVTLKYPNNSHSMHEYDLVIACDGARSVLRDKLDIQLDTYDYGCHFIVFDLNLTSTTNIGINYFLYENGYAILTKVAGHMYRFIMSCQDEKQCHTIKAYSRKELQSLIYQKTCLNVKINSIIWSTSSRFQHRVAQKCAVKNVFLAGDALHAFSPVGGTNMNMGIEDACELACLIQTWHSCHATVSTIAQDYERARRIAINQNLTKTKEFTNILIRSTERNQSLEKLFLPHLNNRLFRKNTLQRILFGFMNFDYNDMRNQYGC